TGVQTVLFRSFEPRISSCRHRTSAPPNFKSSGKLLVDDLSDCSQLRIPSCNFTANFESRAASFEFSPRELQIKRALIEIRLYKEYRIYVSITIKSLLKLQRFDPKPCKARAPIDIPLVSKYLVVPYPS